jgi:hypothetical protein
MSNPLRLLFSDSPAAVINRSQVAKHASARRVFFLLAALASALLLISLKLPLWQMRLEAPQYRDQEALRIAVHPNALRGDLRELTVLDQYIGVHVPPVLPQFQWLPGLLVTGATLGLLVGFLGNRFRSRAMTLLSCALALALGLAAIQAMAQIHDIGHKRDQKTVLAGIKDFTPPFLGTNKIAQFTVTSRLGLGAWLIGGALLLQLTAAWAAHHSKTRAHRLNNSAVDNESRLMPAVSH